MRLRHRARRRRGDRGRGRRHRARTRVSRVFAADSRAMPARGRRATAKWRANCTVSVVCPRLQARFHWSIHSRARDSRFHWSINSRARDSRYVLVDSLEARDSRYLLVNSLEARDSRYLLVDSLEARDSRFHWSINSRARDSPVRTHAAHACATNAGQICIQTTPMVCSLKKYIAHRKDCSPIL